MNAWRSFPILALLAAAGGRAAADDDGDWPAYQRDARRSAVAGPLSAPLVEVWRHRADQAPAPAWPEPAEVSYWQRLGEHRPRAGYDRACHVVVAGGALYYASSSDDQVRCIDAASGAPRWRFFADGPVRFAPAASGDALFFGSDDGHVYALERHRGALAWKYRAAPEDRRIAGNGRIISAWPVRVGILVDGGVVYGCAGLFPGEGVYAFALRDADGGELWRRKLEGVSPQGYLLASATAIYVPMGRANPFALERAGGALLGSFPGAGGAYAVLTDEGLISGPGADGVLDVAEASSRHSLASFRGEQAVVSGSRAFILESDGLAAVDLSRRLKLTRELAAFDARLKDLSAKRRAAGETGDAAAALAAEAAQLAGAAAKLRAELPACELWRRPLRHGRSLILAGDMLAVGGDGDVALHAASSGAPLWSAKVDGRAYGLAAARGRLYVSTDRGAIHAFAPEGAARPEAKLGPAPAPEAPRGAAPGAFSAALEAMLQGGAAARGLAVVIDWGSGGLGLELAKRSEYRIVGFDADAERVAAARERLSRDGLYGSRVTVHHVQGSKLPLADGLANLVVSERAISHGDLPTFAPAEIHRVTRPYGGRAWVGPLPEAARSGMADAVPRLERWAGGAPGGEWTLDRGAGLARLMRGPIPDGGDWSHAYADPGNTASSGDRRVRGEFRLQWFGGPGPRPMADRHLRAPPPLVCAGRLLIPARDLVIAVDAFNGAELWQTPIPGATRFGIPYDSSWLAASSSRVFAAAGAECRVLSAGDGSLQRSLPLPSQPGDVATKRWGYLAVVDDAVLGSVQKAAATRKHASRDDVVEQYAEFRPLVTSEALFAAGAEAGELRWMHAGGAIPNSAIAGGGGGVYFIESRGAKALADPDGRVDLETLLEGECELLALDLAAGRPRWRRAWEDRSLRHALFVSYARGIVLAAGSFNHEGSVWYRLHAFDARDGSPLWQAAHPNSRPGIGGDHGEQVHHPAIVGGLVIAEPLAYDLASGRRASPGAAAEWSLPARSGCGTISASAGSLFYRDGNPICLDLEGGRGPRPITEVSRPGCWINAIPACGLLVIPEASSGCVCAYPLQTSMAFRPVDG